MRKTALASWLALAAVVLVLGAEVCLRWVRPLEFMRIREVHPSARGGWYGLMHRPSEVPGLPYELVPGLDQQGIDVHVRTNSLGMRDDEPLPRDTPGLFRILALGDSLAFGYRVTAEQGFCCALERGLAQSPPAARRFEVLNAGVSGYCARDEAAALEGKWLALEPHLVLLAYCLNDPECDPLQPLPRFFAGPRWWQHSAVLRWLVQREQGRKVRELGGGDYFRALHAPEESSWKSVEQAFARIAAAARPRTVVLAIFPMFSPDPWQSYGYRAQHAQVAREGERHGFLVLDLLPRFEREPPESLVLGPIDSHPNANGHHIAAEAILEFMAEHWERMSAGR